MSRTAHELYEKTFPDFVDSVRLNSADKTRGFRSIYHVPVIVSVFREKIKYLIKKNKQKKQNRRAVSENSFVNQNRSRPK